MRDHCSNGCLTKRSVLSLGASAAASLFAAAFDSRGWAQSAGGGAPGIIDVHHHVSPPGFINALLKYQAGERPMLDWTPARSIEDMDRAGVALSIISITTPGVWFGDREEARRLARECNDYGAKLKADFPGRFGLFASLPLPDVEDSLKEIEYVFEHLNADGVGVMTSFGDRWLGDESWVPVMDELNRRKGDRVHASYRCQLLPQRSAGCALLGRRAVDRYDTRHRKRRILRNGGAFPRHTFHFFACWRDDALRLPAICRLPSIGQGFGT